MDTTDPYELNHRVPTQHPRHYFQGHHIISDQITREGLAVVWRELDAVLQAATPGDITEFGCYVGTTSLFIRRLLNSYRQSDVRAFHVYDSFEGLPAKTDPDQSAAGADFQAGMLPVSRRQLLQQFRTAALQPPIVHKGWFDTLTAQDAPHQIAFAFLDGDFYSSILSSLQLVWPHMQPGGKILVDDFKRETLPGVEHALIDFLGQGRVNNLHYEQNIAIIDV